MGRRDKKQGLGVILLGARTMLGILVRKKKRKDMERREREGDRQTDRQRQRQRQRQRDSERERLTDRQKNCTEELC